MIKIDIPMPNSCTECPFAYVDYTTNIPGCDVMADLPNCPDYDIHTKTEQKDKNCPLSAIYDCDDAVSKEAVSKWLKQYGQDVLHGKYKFSLMYIWKNIMDLPSVTHKQKE